MIDQGQENSIEVKYPFRVETIFFQKVFVERPESFEEDFQFALETQLALGFPDEDKFYLVHLRTYSTEETKKYLDLDVVQIAMFEHIGDGEPADEVLVEYINEFLLIAMASNLIQFIGAMTSQMGRSPIWMPMPRGFGFDVDTLYWLREHRQEKMDLT